MKTLIKILKKVKKRFQVIFRVLLFGHSEKMYVNHDWMEIWLSSFLLIANMKLIKSSSDY